MDATNWDELGAGAYSTPLVGRANILGQIETTLNDQSLEPRIVFITGGGGIGKTRLLAAALEVAQHLSGLHVARAIVDLYHVPTHTPAGLTFALYQALKPPTDTFQEYIAARKKLESMHLSGDISGIAAQRTQALETFGQD